jgi:hypothetical protein
MMVTAYSFVQHTVNHGLDKGMFETIVTFFLLLHSFENLPLILEK